MKKLAYTLGLLGCMTSASADMACAYNPDFIGLKYAITTKVLDEDAHAHHHAAHEAHTKSDQHQHLTIWRNQRAVIHERGESDITDLWLKVDDKGMALTRYFDRYQRAIEYDIADLPQRSLGLWNAKRQVVPNVYKTQMQKIGERGTGCEKVEYYAYASPKHQYVMTWSPAKEAVVEYLTNIKGTVSQWQLTDTITDTKTVYDVFATRDDWQSTDYADVGDNESDPFLAKMITLGFIQHSDGGFYDADGKPLGHGMHHHGH